MKCGILLGIRIGEITGPKTLLYEMLRIHASRWLLDPWYEIVKTARPKASKHHVKPRSSFF